MVTEDAELQSLPPSHHNGTATREAPDKSNDHRQPDWRKAIENFSAIWFTLPMNTGILAILMHNLPYQFNGLGVLSTIMYIFQLVLFISFSSVFILRLILYPRSVRRMTTSNMDEAAMWSTAPIAFLTMSALTAIIVSDAGWGGHGFSLVAYVMWWIGTVWMFTTTVSVCLLAFRKDLIDGRTMSTSIILPVVGMATNSVAGGLICVYGIDVSARIAVPVLITSYLLVGMAVWLALILYTLYFHRLLASGWPAPAQLPTLFLLIGPYGQTASGLLNLGTAAQSRNDFGGYNSGVFLTSMSASGVSAASTLIALLLLGLDIFLIIIALAGIVEGAMKRQLTYNMTWWSTIFPLGTTTLAFLSLGIALDSPTFRVLTTALLIILLIMYFLNWGFTIYHAIFGDLLFKRPRNNAGEYGEKKD